MVKSLQESINHPNTVPFPIFFMIMVSNFSSIMDNLELKNVQKEHLKRFEDLKFASKLEDLKFESISKLCDSMNVEFDPDRPLDTISTLALAIGTKHPDYYTILMIDEVISNTTNESFESKS